MANTYSLIRRNARKLVHLQMKSKLGLYITYAIYLLTLIGILFAFVYPHFVIAKEVTKIEIEVAKVGYVLGDKIPQEVINELVNKYTNQDETYLGYNKRYAMRRIIYCESWNRNIQSTIVKHGIQEDSWGVAQIHLPSHPKITKEQALDVEFSVKFMADNLGKVAWYGWNSKLDKCN